VHATPILAAKNIILASTHLFVNHHVYLRLQEPTEAMVHLPGRYTTASVYSWGTVCIANIGPNNLVARPNSLFCCLDL
jgi:hypothetical protein